MVVWIGIVEVGIEVSIFAYGDYDLFIVAVSSLVRKRGRGLEYVILKYVILV